jgi:hypothetical protein
MKVVSWFVCASAVMLSAPAASAAPLTNPLTPDQVTCDELQLERLRCASQRLNPAQTSPIPRSSCGGAAKAAAATRALR